MRRDREGAVQIKIKRQDHNINVLYMMVLVGGEWCVLFVRVSGANRFDLCPLLVLLFCRTTSNSFDEKKIKFYSSLAQIPMYPYTPDRTMRVCFFKKPVGLVRRLIQISLFSSDVYNTRILIIPVGCMSNGQRLTTSMIILRYIFI